MPIWNAHSITKKTPYIIAQMPGQQWWSPKSVNMVVFIWPHKPYKLGTQEQWVWDPSLSPTNLWHLFLCEKLFLLLYNENVSAPPVSALTLHECYLCAQKTLAWLLPITGECSFLHRPCRVYHLSIKTFHFICCESYIKAKIRKSYIVNPESQSSA